jgi:hypothetical protein
VNFALRRVVDRTERSIRNYGLRKTAVKLFIILNDYAFDLWHQIDTVTWTRPSDIEFKQSQGRAEPYQPTRVWPLRQLLRELDTSLPANKVLVDFGCGKARVLTVASDFGFDDIRGIEISGALCKIAKDNCAKYKGSTRKKANIEIIQCNAAEYEIREDENVFFMFNPFDRITTEQVGANISRSLHLVPRDVILIFNNLMYPDVLQNMAFSMTKRNYVFGGHNFAVYIHRKNGSVQ